MFNMQKLEDTIFNLTMNLSPAENKVNEATNEESWGPSPSLMEEIAELTENEKDFPEVMGMLLKRIRYERHKWRRVIKGLTLLNYLILNGSERVVTCCRHRKSDIQYVEILKRNQKLDLYEEQRNTVEKKVNEILGLIQDDKKLKEARKQAKDDKDKYIGISSVNDLQLDDEVPRFDIGEKIAETLNLNSIKSSFSRVWSSGRDYNGYNIPRDGQREIFLDDQRKNGLMLGEKEYTDLDEELDAEDNKECGIDEIVNTLPENGSLKLKTTPDTIKSNETAKLNDTKVPNPNTTVTDLVEFGDFKSIAPEPRIELQKPVQNGPAASDNKLIDFDDFDFNTTQVTPSNNHTPNPPNNNTHFDAFNTLKPSPTSSPPADTSTPKTTLDDLFDLSNFGVSAKQTDFSSSNQTAKPNNSQSMSNKTENWANFNENVPGVQRPLQPAQQANGYSGLQPMQANVSYGMPGQLSAQPMQQVKPGLHTHTQFIQPFIHSMQPTIQSTQPGIQSRQGVFM